MGVVWSPGVGSLGACHLYYLGRGMSGSSAQRLNEGTGSCLLPLSHHTVSHPQESLSRLTQSLTPGLQEARRTAARSFQIKTQESQGRHGLVPRSKGRT